MQIQYLNKLLGNCMRNYCAGGPPPTGTSSSPAQRTARPTQTNNAAPGTPTDVETRRPWITGPGRGAGFGRLVGPARVGGATAQTNFAHNFPRSLFETARKRCNSDDANSIFEQAAGELRAKLLCGRAAAHGHIKQPGPTGSPAHTNKQRGARNTRGATQHHSHTAPPQPAPTTKRGRDRFPGHGLVTQSAPLRKTAPRATTRPIRRSCPRGLRPRRGQPRGGRRGRGTASRTRSPGPRCGRSGSTAGRHRARHTRRA